MSMSKRSVTCKHFRARSQYDTCEAGIEYSTFDGVPFSQRPCFGYKDESPRPGCSLVVLPTAEEVAAEEAEWAKLFNDT